MTIPSHIGQYRIIRKIGAGGMGLVFLGEHTLLGRRAAIKTLLPTVAANREIVERFFNEARATSSIVDPGVIQIFDFGYHVDGTAYIVMELLEGEALSARLERLGKLPLGDALRFARQIAGSLSAAHARDIIHRDLKPENIFLVRDAEAQGGERIKIIDFGICKTGASDPMLTEAGAMIGTPVYMSPEQCRGSATVDQRSDIYGFGCLLFHLLTGRPPFVGQASGDLIVAHLQEPPPRLSQFAPEVPAPVDELVLQCMAKAPDDRFASMTALQAALGDLATQFDGDASLAAATPPPATVPLGRGFRSMYDANLAAWLGGSRAGALSTHALRGRLQVLSPPPTPPDAASPGEPDSGDSEELDVPPSRAGVRAVLACVLVVGVVLGLIATPLILRDDDAPVAHASQPAALPVEATAPAAPVAPAAALGSVPAAASFANLEHPARPAARPGDDGPSRQPRDTTDAPDDESPLAALSAAAGSSESPRGASGSRSASRAGKSGSASRQRSGGDDSAGSSRARSAAALSHPVTSPSELPAAAPSRAPAIVLPPAPAPTTPPAAAASPPAPAARTSAPVAPAAASPAASPGPSAGSARTAPPPSPSTEDLYDTR